MHQSRAGDERTSNRSSRAEVEIERVRARTAGGARERRCHPVERPAIDTEEALGGRAARRISAVAGKAAAVTRRLVRIGYRAAVQLQGEELRGGRGALSHVTR